MQKNYFTKMVKSMMNPLVSTSKNWKKSTTSWLVALFVLCGASDVFGQVANYTFSESAGTYTTISGTTAIASGWFGWDDAVTANTIPIGFTFNFNGTNYTTCSINSNGYITFGANISASNLFLPISDNTGYAGAISGFGVDLRDNNTRNILYTTTGTAPNRVFTVQWREARRFAEAGNLDFQIKLFETSNRIDIVYANFGLNNNNVNVQVGLRGANNTDFNNRSLTTTNTAWDINTTAGGANNATCRSRNDNQPSSGRTFTWTPPTPPTITSLGAASGCVGSTLTINGTNLLTATAVTIGGTAATITGTTATSVTVTVGTGTTGTVQVTTPGGSATSAATFTVNPLPAAIGGGATTVCTGVSTPAFTNATPGGTWSVIPAGGTASITAGGILTGTTAGNVRVRYTLPSGCFIETANIAVQQTPGAITGGAATVCVGSSTPAFTNPNGGGTWSVLNGTGAATITSPGGVLTGTTAGTVTVRYTIGSCTPATYNVTVNPTPTAIGGGAATVCVGGTTPAFTNATAGGTWSIVNGTGSANISTGGVVTGVTAGSATVVYTLGSCSVSTPITIITTPTITTNPTSVSVAVGANSSFTVVASNTPSSYTWEVSTDGGTTWNTVTNGGVYSGATTATLTLTAVPFTMNGYRYRARATNGCGSSSNSTVALLTVNLVYCAPTHTNSCSAERITNVTFNTLNNNSLCANTNGTSYTNYALAGTPTTSVLSGSSYNLSVTTGSTSIVSVWIDFNRNGTFEATEWSQVYTTGTTGTISVAIPMTALPGNTTMRVRSRLASNINGSGDACTSFGSGETEDYLITIVAPAACTTPTAQPTALGLTPSGTTIAGSFTAASPAPNSYLVVVSTSATPPSAPIDGTTYAIGSTIAPGYYVIDNDSNTSFAVTGLNISTTYYIYIYSFNSLCTGGPLYNITSPLTGNITTSSTAPTYCNTTSDDTDALYINSVAFVGTLTDPPVNTSTFNATGFQDFTGLATKAIQAQGEGINIVARSNGVVLVRGTWKAWVDWNKNGTFEPASEEVYNIQGFVGADATFGFVIPPATLPGDYRIRIRVNNGTDWLGGETFGFDFSPCDNFTEGVWFGDDNYGETEDYLFTVVAKCNSLITTVTNGSRCDAGTVTLGATATAGVTEFRWYTTATGGSYTTSPVVGSSTTFTTPSISTTTNYYVTAWNGTCETQVRTLVIAKVSPIPVVSFTPASPVICGENSIISLTATGDTEITHLINENFEGAGLGVFSNINNDANGAVVDAITSWKNQTSTFVPTTTNVWFPAVSSGFGTNKFALAYSDSDPTPTNTIENSIALTTAVSSNTFLNLTLKLKLYYSRYFPDAYIDPLSDEYVSIELSTNGGTTYPIVLQTFTSDVGIGTRFAELSYDLTAYINQPNLKIRVRHRSYAGTGWLPDGVAIDDVELFGTKPLNTAFNYDTATVDAFTNPGATIPYVSGAPATTIYIKPTLTQLENATFNIPVSATLSNGCSATGSVTVTNNTKMFVAGTTGTDWNTATNWRPNGVPTANNCVVIFDNDVNITGTNYTGYGLNLTVKPSGNLNIASSNSSIITDIVNVEAGGVLEIENDASLVQINNVTNTGNIVYKRTAPSIRGFDYVYWSSPVVNQNIGTIYTSPVSGLKYQWNPTVANGNGGQGNWETASGNMQRAKGYIVRGSSNYGMPATNIDATFTGVPHNGNIPFTISRGSYTGAPYNGTNGVQITNINDNYNLLGNPYPSAIDAQEFLATNTYHATTNPSGVIYGNVKLWTHGYQPAAIVNPFYGSFAYNYNANDYVTLNYLGASDPIGASNIIKSGQAFFVQMVDGTAGSGTINFSNGMRLDASNNSYNNSGFFRTSTNEFEKHRIWLDLIDSNNIASGTLVGYATDATYGFDTFFDAQAAVPAFMKIYSLIGNDVYDIQGRSLPFDQNDQVPLGATFVEAGNYKIALNTIDGLFLDSNQNIYLEDKDLNITHNLKVSPYNFTTSLGTFHNRFVLKFNNETLGNEDFIANNVTVYTNESINISASNQVIKSVRVHDLLGRVLGTFNNVNSNTFSSKNIAKTQSPLLVEVTLSNGTVVSKKAIY